MSDHPGASREQALATCLRLPAAELTHPFGEQTAVYKVAGKMFAAVRLDETPTHVTLKCEPDYGASLVAEHEDVTPAYHMDKRHWITVSLPSAVSQDLVDKLITDSYYLVVETLPAKARPGQ